MIKELLDKEWLYSKYRIEKMTMLEIAKLLNCGETTVHKWITKHNIEKFSRSERLTGVKRSQETKDKLSKLHEGKWSGKSNPKYKDGRCAFRIRSRNSRKYRKARREVLKEKNYTCELCGMDAGVMHIHHIVPIRKGGNLIEKENMMVLCMTCHRLLHSLEGIPCTF